MMDWRLVPLYAFVLAFGIGALWWLVFPGSPIVAVQDGFLAGAVASVGTGMLSRCL